LKSLTSLPHILIHFKQNHNLTRYSESLY